MLHSLLRACILDHLGPLFCFLCQQPPEIAGVPASAVPPVSPRRAFIVGSRKAALISPLRLSIISAGVSVGTPTPVTALASYPGTNSPKLGVSGNTAERVAVVTASGRSLPALTGAIDADMGSNIICASPSIRPLSAGPPPA